MKKYTPAFCVLFILVIAGSCSKDATNSINTTSSSNEILSTHFIGEQFGGGIIYWMTENKKNGLIFDTTSMDAAWWDGIKTKVGRTDSVLGSGVTNTNRIVKTLGDNNAYAAKICYDYKGSGFDDWFLPSTKELMLLQQQKDLVDKYKIYSVYWTSTEDNNAGAWYVSFDGGTPITGINRKKNGLGVIAVRSF